MNLLCNVALVATVELCIAHAFRTTNLASHVNMVVDHKTIAGVPMYNYHLAHIARSELRGQGNVLLEVKQEQIANKSTMDWVLMMKPNITDTQIHSLCVEGNRCLFQGYSVGVPFVNLEATESELEELLERHPDTVEFVEPDLPTFAIPEVPAEAEDNNEVSIQAAKTWGLSRIGKSSRRRSGAGANIYVIDTGVRFSHKQFRGRAKPAIDVTTGRLQVCGSNTACAYDRQGHGTHCAGTAAGKNYGVAPGATIHSVKVLGDNGYGQNSWTIAAMDWMVRNAKKPAVASMSLGSRGRSQASQYAVDRMVSAGITVVVAAGNDNQDACNFDPAFISSAITVGSIDRGDRRSGFSNFGRCVDIFAPGRDVYSAKHTSNTATQKLSGTSMACPHVSGAAALILAADKNLRPSSVWSRIRAQADRNRVADDRGSANLILKVGSF
jgi:subtilisin family serine protease